MVKRVIYLLCLFTTLVPLNVFADDFAPIRPWYSDLDDGYVLHFTPVYDPVFGDLTHDFEALGYLPTGLYFNGELVYHIPQHGMGAMFFSGDRTSFISLPTIFYSRGVNQQGRYLGDGSAVMFFNLGNIIYSYSISDLVNDYEKIAFSTTMAFWYDSRNILHDHGEDTLQITTYEGRTFTFDLTTGRIVNEVTASSTPIFDEINRDEIIITSSSIGGFSAFIIICIILFMILYRWRKKASALPQNHMQ